MEGRHGYNASSSSAILASTTARLSPTSARRWLARPAFIGSETDTSQHLEVLANGDQVTLVANRWAMLTDLDRICREHGLAIDAETAIVLDLDKTTLGARGRNDHVIDAARVAAVRETVASLLGSDFDASRFEADYALFNRTEFHPFTTDNQDYLAYLCLILGSDLVTASDLAEAIRGDRLTHFAGFLEQVEARAAELPDQLRALHAEIYSLVKAGGSHALQSFSLQRVPRHRATDGSPAA